MERFVFEYRKLMETIIQTFGGDYNMPEVNELANATLECINAL